MSTKIKFGFEKEFFVKNSINQYVIVPGFLPKDECGYLAEARGEPHSDVIQAVFNLKCETYKLKVLFSEKDLVLTDDNTLKLPKQLLREAIRSNGKDVYPNERGNIYNKDYSPNDTYNRAGLHIHFSKTKYITYNDPKLGSEIVHKIPMQMDFVKIIRTLDDRFIKDIQDAKRIPGFYEFKPHGFEYRSLPAHIDLLKVAETVKNLKI